MSYKQKTNKILLFTPYHSFNKINQIYNRRIGLTETQKNKAIMWLKIFKKIGNKSFKQKIKESQEK